MSVSIEKFNVINIEKEEKRNINPLINHVSINIKTYIYNIRVCQKLNILESKLDLKLSFTNYLIPTKRKFIEF